MSQEAASLNSLPEYILGLARLGRRRALIEQHLYRSLRLSYAELIGRACGMQQELARRGIGPGDRVMLWGASGAAWAIAFYGCLLQGAVVVPLDAAFSPELAARVRQQTEAALLCSDHTGADLGTPLLAFDAILSLPAAALPATPPPPPPETLLEIVYTSGATAEPKGVMITHGNVLANLRPVANEVRKYKRKLRLVLPLGFLHLIPLSHLFGQIMGLFIPAMVDSCVIYPETQAPAQWAAILKRYRASALVAVPQQLYLFSQWAEAEIGMSLVQARTASQGHKIYWRFWRWRKLHRKLGWKMWAFIVGGAALAPALEEGWNALGYAVVQGYGLTETAPAIAITHPFKIRRGAVGQTLDGVEVKIAPDGEILVRGGNVSPGYYHNPSATAQAFQDGWLHTGDLGKIDANKNLTFLGRKKEVIVTPDGLNVYPEDVERALKANAAVADAAAVEDQRGGAGQVHAVVVLRDGLEAGALDAIVAAANAHLEPHQRIRAASLWPQPQLPRTTSTHKLQRMAIARWVNQGQPQTPDRPGDGDPATWKQFVTQRWGIAPGRLQPNARLDTDLGLSSLDRVELWSWMEAHTPGGFDETALAVAQTVADVEALAAPAEGNGSLTGAVPSAAVPRAPLPSPGIAVPAHESTWPLRPSLRHFRTGGFYSLVFPFLRTAVTRVTVEGAEQFARLDRPLFFIANHQSMLDVPLILRALPPEWRPWLAPAMGIDPFVGAFNPRASGWRRFRDRWRLRLTQLFFNTYLLTPQGAVGASLRHTGRLADQGYCPLIFPEGRRTPDGRMHPFRPGIGVFAAALRLPIMPIYLEGLYEILPDGARRAKPGRARVRFGPVMHFPHETGEEITARLESWYKMAK
ncbi:MAG TPA: AMP-binding protein [Terriglobales bacterium]|nr:AMP-binding protein [Terriglobales bacterium]